MLSFAKTGAALLPVTITTCAYQKVRFPCSRNLLKGASSRSRRCTVSIIATSAAPRRLVAIRLPRLPREANRPGNPSAFIRTPSSASIHASPRPGEHGLPTRLPT